MRYYHERVELNRDFRVIIKQFFKQIKLFDGYTNQKMTKL